MIMQHEWQIQETKILVQNCGFIGPLGFTAFTAYVISLVLTGLS